MAFGCTCALEICASIDAVVIRWKCEGQPFAFSFVNWTCFCNGFCVLCKCVLVVASCFLFVAITVVLRWLASLRFRNRVMGFDIWWNVRDGGWLQCPGTCGPVIDTTCSAFQPLPLSVKRRRTCFLHVLLSLHGVDKLKACYRGDIHLPACLFFFATVEGVHQNVVSWLH